MDLTETMSLKSDQSRFWAFLLEDPMRCFLREKHRSMVPDSLKKPGLKNILVYSFRFSVRQEWTVDRNRRGSRTSLVSAELMVRTPSLHWSRILCQRRPRTTCGKPGVGGSSSADVRVWRRFLASQRVSLQPNKLLSGAWLILGQHCSVIYER